MASTSSNSLASYVQEQKGRSPNGALASGLQGSFKDLGAKLSTGFSSTANLFGGGAGSSARLLDDEDEGFDGVKTEQPKAANGSSSGGGGWFNFSGQESSSAFGLSRTQRIFGFMFCLIAGTSCFVLASFYIPVLVFKSRKFAALNTLGSVFFLFSFALLWGPAAYAKNLFSQPRLPVTLAYVFSVLATLYCSLWINNTILTIVCACVQAIALLWFVATYVPGGERGLRFMTGICKRMVSSKSGSVLPV